MKTRIIEHGKIYHNPDSFFRYCGWPTLFKSFDKGRNWSKLGEVRIPDGTNLDNFHEPYAIELDGNKILGVIRAQNMNTEPSFTMIKPILMTAVKAGVMK